jgi:hypothetical protein
MVYRYNREWHPPPGLKCDLCLVLLESESFVQTFFEDVVGKSFHPALSFTTYDSGESIVVHNQYIYE